MGFGILFVVLVAIAATFLVARAALEAAIRRLPHAKARLDRLVSLLEARAPARLRASVRRRLKEAGRPEAMDERRLLAVTVGLGALAILSLTLALFGGVSLGLPLVFGLAAAAPWLWLSRRARERKEAIARELPFVLDLLTLTLEAGSDLLTGMARVAERMRPGALRDEVVHALRELRLGRPRRDVFGDLAARTGSPEVARMVALVLQADRMGAPVGENLRLLSGQLLVERFLLAEKKAAQAPVKILLPLAAFIFPAVFLVLFGPIALALWTG